MGGRSLRAQDVYTEVARRVIQAAADDIRKGPGRTPKSQAHHDVALRISEVIDRKLVRPLSACSCLDLTPLLLPPPDAHHPAIILGESCSQHRIVCS